MSTAQAPATKRRRITGMPYHLWNDEQDFMLALCLALQCTTQLIIGIFAKCYKVTLRSTQLNSISQMVKKRALFTILHYCLERICVKNLD